MGRALCAADVDVQHCRFVTSAFSGKVTRFLVTDVGNPIFKRSNGAIQQSIVK